MNINYLVYRISFGILLLRELMRQNQSKWKLNVEPKISHFQFQIHMMNVLKLGMATSRVFSYSDPTHGPNPARLLNGFFFFFPGPVKPCQIWAQIVAQHQKKKKRKNKERNHWSPKKELKNKRLLFFAPFLFPLQHHLCADPLPINWVCKVTQHRNSKSF